MPALSATSNDMEWWNGGILGHKEEEIAQKTA
jgi:hypothetical protein